MSEKLSREEFAEKATLALHFIITEMMDDYESVRIKAELGPDTINILVRVADADVGKIIGKQGRTAQALRTVLMTISGRYKHAAVLTILERGEPI